MTIPRLLTGAALAALAIASALAAGAAQQTVSVPPVPREGTIDPRTLPVLPAAGVSAKPPVAVPNQFPDASTIPGAGRVDLGWPRPTGDRLTYATAPDPGTVRAPSETYPALDTRFDAPYDGGVTPPDPNMAVGRDHVVSILNLRVAFHTKAGAIVGGPYSLASFFNIPGNYSPFDPLVIYDPFRNRFIAATAADDGVNKDSRIFVAFSQTGDPTGLWNKYSFRTDRNQVNNWADYPSVGIDRFAVYFTANMFARSGGFNNVTVFIYDKAAGYAGAPLTGKHLINVRTASNGAPFRLRPAYVPTTTAGDTYWLAHTDNTFGSVINLFTLTGDRLNAPVLTASTVALSTTYFPPGKGRQPGSGGGVDSLGANLWNVYYRNGSLWMAQSISGTSGDAAWVHKLDVTTTPATRVNTWQVEASNADTYFPYVLPEPDTDDFALMSAFSSATQYVTGRYWNVSAAGTVRLTDLTATSIARNDNNRHGDYFSIASDPRDRNRVWMIAEYMKNGGSSGNSGIASARFKGSYPVPAAPAPVPDGKTIVGQEVTVTRAAGSNVTLHWDSASCSAAGHHLVWFDLANMAGYVVAAETCGAGNTGTWTGSPPAGSVGVLVVSDDNARTEGSHGVDSNGIERPSTSRQCGFVQKLDFGVCTP